MKYVIGYAGIPSDLFGEIEKHKSTLVGDNGQFEGIPLTAGSPLYEQRHASYLLTRFKERILADKKSALQETGFAVIYIIRDHESTDSFAQEFFPTTLLVPVKWERCYGTAMQNGQSKNELFKKLRNATVNAKKALQALHDEISQRSNKTPLLLPMRNFRSGEFCAFLIRLQTELLESDDRLFTIRNAVHCLQVSHPLQKVGSRNRPCYVDDVGIEFHAPGSLRHGFARGEEDGHLARCILGSRRRLGAPYDPKFHYDCLKGSGNLRSRFFGCHTEAIMREGHPHLNIAPNDHVR